MTVQNPTGHPTGPLPGPEPMGGPGARKRARGQAARGTPPIIPPRPNRNKVTLSLSPVFPSTPQTEEAVRKAADEKRRKYEWKGHDSLCLLTYAEAHTLRYGKDKEHLTEVPPTPKQTPKHCHCVCARCFDRILARCICRLCRCARPEDVFAGFTAGTRITNSRLPQTGFD
jgi:hypothetical protein